MDLLAIYDVASSWLFAIITVATALDQVARLTPTQKDDAVMAKVLKTLRVAALKLDSAFKKE